MKSSMIEIQVPGARLREISSRYCVGVSRQENGRIVFRYHFSSFITIMLFAAGSFFVFMPLLVLTHYAELLEFSKDRDQALGLIFVAPFVAICGVYIVFVALIRLTAFAELTLAPDDALIESRTSSLVGSRSETYSLDSVSIIFPKTDDGLLRSGNVTLQLKAGAFRTILARGDQSFITESEAYAALCESGYNPTPKG
jgi:hypothetical protein